MIYVAITADGTDKVFFFTVDNESRTMEKDLKKAKSSAATQFQANGIIDDVDDLKVFKSGDKDKLQEKLDDYYANSDSGQ